MKRTVLIGILLGSLGTTGWGQRLTSLTDSLHYRVEVQTTLSDGDHTPLWLNANRHGLSSLRTANGYVRGALSRSMESDLLRRWGVDYAVDVAVPTGFTSHFVVQQAYVEGRWLRGRLTLGSKEYPMELKNQKLSSGAQTLGINARPIPQLRLALPDYWTVPGLRGWLAVKGHLAYGMPTDGRWQKNFTQRQSHYVEHGLYHSKAGYLRIGPRNITLELGLEMACQFGGTTHQGGPSGGTIKNGRGFPAFLNALTSGGADATDSHWSNNAGNHLGSWVARLNMDYAAWNLGLYADRYFEDHSAMLFVDYDGYGSGDEWDKKKQSRFFLYDLKDMMLGAELRLKRLPWLNNIVLEYLYTKYQSGPINHDHTQNISDHIGGGDNYYNHNLQPGWQHWGMVMGNPLYRSPLYNTDGMVQVKNNRFVAWHLGVGGQPLAQLHYRVLATWQRGYGTYDEMFPDPCEDVSLLAEATYTLPRGGWQLKAAFGLDSGRIYGDNVGLQLTVVKTGILKTRKR